MSPADLEQLAAQARHARQRYDLYKAKAYGSRPTSATRMRELAREAEAAEARLRAARADAGPTGSAS
ncbi:MAG TPA: hypothetical protein VGG41_19530 [Solirubrobacteraceae bacterium]